MKEALRKRRLLNVGRLTYSMGLMLAAEVSQARWYWQALSRYNASKGFKFRLVNWASPSMDLWGASGSTLSSRQELDILQLSLPTLLRLEDRNSMGYGLETRLPFLDYRVIEMALALPARLKIAKGYGKWALRRISEGVVPDSIRLTRKKRGFDVAQSWVERGIGASLRRRLHENRNALSAHLRPGIDLDRELSIAALARDGNLLDEALMLAWLAQPVRI